MSEFLDFCQHCGKETKDVNEDGLCKDCEMMQDIPFDGSSWKSESRNDDYTGARRVTLDNFSEISDDITADKTPDEKKAIQQALLQFLAWKHFEALTNFWQGKLEGECENKDLQAVLENIANYLKVSELIDREAGTQVLVCPRCDTRNDLHAGFCKECGEDIALPPDEKSAAEQAMDYIQGLWPEEPDED